MPTYQAPQIDASPNFDAARGNEWGRNGWTKESYDRKNQEPVNFYDFTRKKLNFEIKRGEPLRDKDGNVRKNEKGHILYSKPSIIPLGTHPMTIKKRYNQRLEEIGHKPWKNANGNQPNTNVSIVLNGDHDRMTEIAFGKATYFEKGTDNSLTQLLTVSKDEIEFIAKKYGVDELVDTDQTYSMISIYALCFYKFLCDKFGEENVMGLACHLDETTPHFHALVIPVAEKQKSGRVGGYTLVDANQNPVLDENGDEIHITTRAYERMPENQRANYVKTKSTTIGLSYASYFGKTPGQTSRSYEKWHDMIHEEVTKQWGFDRGERLRDMTPEERADHRRKSKKQLERERLAAERRKKEEEEKEKEAKKRREEQEKMEQEAKARVMEAQNKKATLDKEIETATAKLSNVNTELGKWGAMVFDEKSIKYPSLTEMTTADGHTFKEILEEKINELVEVLNKPIGTFQKHDNWKVDRNREAKAIVSELEDALFGPNGVDTAHKKAILQLGKDLYFDAKSKISNIYKENERLKKENQELKSATQILTNNYNTVKRNNTQLETELETEKTANTLLSQQLEREKLAKDGYGNNLEWTSGPRQGQKVTKDEYQKILQKKFDAKEKELKAEKVAREKEREDNRSEWMAHKRHMRELKAMVLAIFSADARRFIDIIIKHWKAEIKEFTRDVMNDIKSILFGAESTVNGRKVYVSDAFVWAKVFADLEMDDKWKPDHSKLEPLREDAMRIADGTWESYHSNQKLKDAAVEAVASLANTPNLKYCDEGDIEAVNDYLDSIPVGERNVAITELRERALNDYNIKMEPWLDNVIKRIESNTLGGQGLTR